jgi:hypothetical protein
VNGTIAQIVAIACHGNAALRGMARPRFFPGNSTCQFCERVAFVEMRRGLLGRVEEHAVAPTPDDWFGVLSDAGVLGLRLAYESSVDRPLGDRTSAVFIGGGGQWSLATVSPGSRSDVWMARWEVGNQQAPANRIWRVTYGKVGGAASRMTSASIDLGPPAARLRRTLSEIALFARTHDCAGFADAFEGALGILDAGSGSGPGLYHDDLAPPGILPIAASTMLAACQKAWVFGGMGSWNDLGFEGEDQAEYERVSEGLFQAVNAAIVAAANTSLAVA